jgi:hypothetical protein
MTIAVSQTAPATTSQGLTLDAIRAAMPVLRLIGSICSIPSVRKVTISFGSMQVDVRALMDEEVLEDAHRIYLMERECRQKVGEFPLDVQVVPLSEVDERNLPPGEIVFER